MTFARRAPHFCTALAVALALHVVGGPATLAAQEEGLTTGTSVIVAVGKAGLVTSPVPLRRVSVADPEVAEAVVISPTEVLLNGKKIGSTSLILWDTAGRRRLSSVEVTVDAEALENHLKRLFPDESIEVTASANTFVLSGSVTDGSVARRAVELATSLGATVVDNMQVPAPQQILLQVRFAEVSRTALKALSVNLVRVDPLNLRGSEEGATGTGRHNAFRGNYLNNPAGPDETFSDAVNLYLFDPEAQLGAFIHALKTKGLFKSLAEPNLLALDGKEASFLAGGEFPYPVVQGGGAATQSVTIQFKEFGVRLSFTPHITNSGNINMKIAPEVSSLDFANGLTVSGFQVPTILSRKASTEVELRDGQTFAIAGLIDNSITDNVDKVPILGDIPVLGLLFKSKDLRQNRSELLVLVTPRLVQPSATPPPIPTGEPETWEWEGDMKQPVGQAGKGSAR